MQLSQTRATMFLVTRTTRLRAALRRVDPYQAASIAVLLLIIAGGLVRSSMAPTAPAAQPITVYATPALAGSGEHGTTRRLERAPAALRSLPTAIVPSAVPLPTAIPAPTVRSQVQLMSAPEQPTPARPGYTAHTTAGDVFVPDNATPVPAGATYTGPFLAPAVTDSPAGPRICTGFGDSRDFDPMYESSPACHNPAP